jgi:HEAT repeat protein
MNNEIEVKIKEAIKKGNLEELEESISELLQSKNISSYVDLLNELLLIPFHYQHQYIAMAIQNLESVSSVPFIDKVLESKFEGIPYTGSESRSMARWFSWALYCIGNEEAVEVMKKHTNSTDKGIREEMRYRLNKLDSAEN